LTFLIFKQTYEKKKEQVNRCSFYLPEGPSVHQESGIFLP
jgi:hypothetical protein